MQVVDVSVRVIHSYCSTYNIMFPRSFFFVTSV